MLFIGNDVMTDDFYYSVLNYSLVTMVLLMAGSQTMPAPYGKFAEKAGQYGPDLNPRLGWFLMELPATLSFVYFYWQGSNRWEPVPLFFHSVWLLHYGNRGFYFPFMIRAAKGAKSTFSIMIVLTGWFVTTTHGYLNAVFVSQVGKHFTPDWFRSPVFLSGICLYFLGFVLNVYHDGIIRNLRPTEEIERGVRKYRIPYGGLFTYVTCPSYFSEILSFSGMALAGYNPGGIFVLGVTIGNLLPRAIDSHNWYLKKFGPEYPRERKIIIPFIY